MHTHAGLAVGVSPSVGLSIGAPATPVIAPSGEPTTGTTNIADFRPTPVMSVVIAASAAASAFHGYRRNEGSIGYALLWAGMGLLFPVITPAIAIAEGFAEPEGSSWAAKQKWLAQQEWETKQGWKNK